MVGTFTDNRGSGDVTSFQRVHEGFTVAVDQHSAQGTNLFGDQCAENLCRVSGTSGVILEGVGVQQFCASTVTQNQTVSGSTVVVGGGETLVVETACATSCHDDSFGFCHQNLASFHVQQNSASTLAVGILNQFDSCSEVHHRDLTVQDFVTESTHDFCAGVVLSCVHSLARSTATVGGDHATVFVLIELNAQFRQPTDGIGSFGNQLVQQVFLCGKVTATESIQEVLCRAIIFLIGSLNATFCHHGVGIAHTQFGDNHNVCTIVVSFDSGGSTGATTTDDQDIYIIVRSGQIDIFACNTRVGLQQCCQFVRHLATLVWAHFQGGEFVGLKVGVIGSQQFFFFVSGHATRVQLYVFGTGGLHLCDGIVHMLIMIHGE